jgi:hypothetical protein
MLNSDIDMVEE